MRGCDIKVEALRAMALTMPPKLVGPAYIFAKGADGPCPSSVFKIPKTLSVSSAAEGEKWKVIVLYLSLPLYYF